jgi:uncharacterized membrane protein YbaN (DUF454 family)
MLPLEPTDAATVTLADPRSSSSTSDHGADSSAPRCPVVHRTIPRPETTACVATTGWMPKDLRRWTIAGIGVLATALGIIGAILPGLPTTIFVIIAAWCFARSCPVLEQKLLRNRLFAPSMQIIDGTRPFTPAARAATVGFMASGGAVSTGFLAWTGTLSTPILWTIVASVLIGAVVILLYKPTPRSGG